MLSDHHLIVDFIKTSKMASTQNNNDDNEFIIQSQLLDKYKTRFFNTNPSELHYPAGMVIPKLPMYHPYHPFKRTFGDDVLQVPLAMILPDLKLVPKSLLDIISTINVSIPIISYFVAQTLPYEDDTEVIPRYQYAIFQNAKGEMKGFESMYAQSIIYEGDNLFGEFLPTSIKVYESEKNTVSPTILCGPTKLVLENDPESTCTVDTLRGRYLWSLVLGSAEDKVIDGFLENTSHAFVGCTYFIRGERGYQNFLNWMKHKSPREVLDVLREVISGATLM